MIRVPSRVVGAAVTAVLAAVGTAACGGEEGGGEEKAKGGTFFARAAGEFEGTTIRGVSESTPASAYVKDVLGPKFEEETGIKVDLETTSWDQQYDKAIKDMESVTGIYDFVYVEQDIVYAYLAQKYLRNITDELAKNKAIANPDFDVEGFTSFVDFFKDPKSGDLYGVPMEAFLKTYVYRTDLFENAKNKSAFQQKYGRELAPPKTWEEYRDIAEFFTQQGKGKSLWGTTVQAGSHPAAFYEMAKTIWPAHGVYNWGINQENWKATSANGGELDSPKAVEALEFWTGLLKFAPPEATQSTWDEVASSFAAGRAAQGWVYGENIAWIATDPERSKVVGEVGVDIGPVEKSALSDAEADKGYIGYYDGGAFGVPRTSKNPEAALLFVQYVAQPSVQEGWVREAARVVRTDTFETATIKQLDPKTGGYYTFLQERGDLYGGAPPFPFHNDIREVILPFVQNAIAGKQTPKEALTDAAKAVDAQLVKLGYGKQ
jgi:multiple sugar transport system substrate-binding protein